MVPTGRHPGPSADAAGVLELDGNVLRPRTFNADVFATMGRLRRWRGARLERVGQAADAFALVSEAS